MLRLLEQIPVLGRFVIAPVLNGADIALNATQGGANLVIDGVQVLVIRGALDVLQAFLLGL